MAIANKSQWWRVRLDAEGKIIECAPVDVAGTSAGGVFYVQGLTEQLARKRAYNDYYRLRQRWHRKKLRAEGKCDCGRDREDPKFVQCRHCRERGLVYHERKRRRARGENVEPLSRKESRDARRAEEERQFELAIFEKVQAAWARTLKVGKAKHFTAWLQDQIARLTGRKGKAA